MTRKHFTALAAALAALPRGPLRDECIRAVVEMCQAANRHFDARRFLAHVERLSAPPN